MRFEEDVIVTVNSDGSYRTVIARLVQAFENII